MNAGGAFFVEALSCLSAGAAGWCASCMWFERKAASAQRRILRQNAGIEGGSSAGLSSRGGADVVVRYATGLSRRLAFGAARPLSPRRAGGLSREGRRRGGLWFAEHAPKAGLASDLSPEGFREAGVRLALALAGVGGLVGAVLSNELAVVLGLVGMAVGIFAPRWAVRAVELGRTAEVERHLSEMLEVVALGLRSGLSFDRSFELYAQHFSSSLAEACASASRRWSLGLATRDEALRDLAASYGSDQLTRVVENIVRSLRFGSSLAEGLEAAAVEARAEHRARMEERVAKAPVKMMMPTGALILPAMLLLVLGPVLLDLSGGF